MSMSNLSSSTSATDVDFDLSNIFIGRDKQIEVFKSRLMYWLHLPKENRNDIPVHLVPSPNNRISGLVVLIHGRGGFGKSTLLRRYHDIATFYKQIKVSDILDWEFAAQDHFTLFNPAPGERVNPEDFFNVLRLYLSRILNQKLSSFKNFQDAARNISQINKKAQKVIKNIQQKDDSYSWLREAVSEGAAWALREFVPAGKLMLDEARAEKFKKIFGESLKVGEKQLAVVRTRLKEKLEDDFDNYLEPDRQLALGIGKDLASFAKKRPILIFFDTYEEVDEVDNMLRLIMMASGYRVGWIIAERSNLWAGREQRLRSVELQYGYRDIVMAERSLSLSFRPDGIGRFTLGNVEEYFELLSQNTGCPKISSEEVVQVLKLTRGIPLAVKIAAGIYKEVHNIDAITTGIPDVEDEIVETMVERYLLHAHADTEERLRLYGLAMLRRADQPDAIASALYIASDKIGKEYDSELRRLHRRYSFIFTEKEQPTLHQDVRFFLRKWLLERCTRPDISGISQHLFEAQKEKLKSLEVQYKQNSLEVRFQNNLWIETYLNYIELFFWVEPDEAVKTALAFIIVAAVYNRDVKKDMIEIGNFFRPKLSENIEGLWEAVSLSLIYQKGHNATSEVLSALHRIDETKQQVAFLPPLPSFSQEIEAALWWLLGEAYTGNNDIEAVIWYEKALSILSNNPSLLRAAAEAAFFAGNNYYRKHDNIKAIQYWEKVTTFDPQDITAYCRIGRAYTNLGKNKIAVEYFHKALKIEPYNPLALTGISTSYRYIDHEKAIKYAKRATEVEKSTAESFDYLGLLYRDDLQIEKAIRAHLCARKLTYRPVTDFFLSLLHAHKKDWKQAKFYMGSANENFKKAKHLEETRNAWVKIVQWGKIIVLEEDYDKAKDFAAQEICPHLKTERATKASLSHIEFLLTSCGKIEQIKEYVQILNFL